MPGKRMSECLPFTDVLGHLLDNPPHLRFLGLPDDRRQRAVQALPGFEQQRQLFGEEHPVGCSGPAGLRPEAESRTLFQLL